MALSKIFTVNSVYSQIDVRAHNTVEFTLDPQIEVDSIKNTIMKHYGIANSAFQLSYIATEPLPIVDGVIDISAKNYFRVLSVGHSKNRPYISKDSLSSFRSVQRTEATQTNSSGRYWVLVQGNGNGEIWIYQPPALVTAGTESTVNVDYVRYPDLSWGLDAIQPANSPYIDAPDWAVPHIIMAAAADLLSLAGKQVPPDMAAAVESAVGALAKDLAGNDIAAKQAGRDAITS